MRTSNISTVGRGSKLRILCVLVLICFILSAPQLSAQNSTEQSREEIRIHYRVSKTNIDNKYMGNHVPLNRIVDWVEEAQNNIWRDVVSIEFCGACSPEGSVRFNHYLSRTRLTRLENYVRQRIDIPENIIERSDHYIAWTELEQMVEESNLANKDKILAILRSENRSKGNQLDSRIGALKAMDGGKTWKRIFDLYFAKLRNAYMVIVTQKSSLALDHEQYMAATPTSMPVFSHWEQVAPLEQVSLPVAALAEKAFEPRFMYVKTNLAGLAMLAANIGVEFDLGRYLSLSIPVSYSAINYFKPTLKFRHLYTQPELRVWPLRNYDRLFIGAHVGFGYYNYAFDGDWRYQDHAGKTPTLGGGLSLGYRLPISRNKNWKLEFAVGAGAYPLHYDTFHNVADVKEGELYDTNRKTYIGLDNVTVGISYRIPLKRSKPAKNE